MLFETRQKILEMKVSAVFYVYECKEVIKIQLQSRQPNNKDFTLWKWVPGGVHGEVNDWLKELLPGF